MMAVKLLRYSVAIMLFLLSIGLVLIAIFAPDFSTSARIAIIAGALISALLGAGCIIKPDLAKKVLLGQGFDKYWRMVYNE